MDGMWLPWAYTIAKYQYLCFGIVAKSSQHTLSLFTIAILNETLTPGPMYLAESHIPSQLVRHSCCWCLYLEADVVVNAKE